MVCGDLGQSRPKLRPSTLTPKPSTRWTRRAADDDADGDDEEEEAEA
jgi:hypothetical protein